VDAARRQGLEGLVAKRSSSVYEPGRRSGAWLKVRLQAGQELVVGGYLPGPHRFDALLVGYYARRRLLFIAKVRNGFVPETWRGASRGSRLMSVRSPTFRSPRMRVVAWRSPPRR